MPHTVWLSLKLYFWTIQRIVFTVSIIWSFVIVKLNVYGYANVKKRLYSESEFLICFDIHSVGTNPHWFPKRLLGQLWFPDRFGNKSGHIWSQSIKLDCSQDILVRSSSLFRVLWKVKWQQVGKKTFSIQIIRLDVGFGCRRFPW